jgi:putative hydrolase of the HAD superfamily
MTKGKKGERASIFDFDGTLVDSFTPRTLAHGEVSEVLVRYMRDEGYEPQRKLIFELISRAEQEMNEKKVYDRNFWWKEVLKKYLGKVIRISPSVLREATYIYWETVRNKSIVYQGIKNMLNSLKHKGFALGLISDTDGLEGMKSRRIGESGLREFFDAIVIAGEDTREVKPSTQPFLRISQLLEIPLEHCVFVGDNPEVDVSGPKQLGMKTIIIGDEMPQPTEKTSRPDYFIRREDLGELGEIIPRMLRVE